MIYITGILLSILLHICCSSTEFEDVEAPPLQEEVEGRRENRPFLGARSFSKDHAHGSENESLEQASISVLPNGASMRNRGFKDPNFENFVSYFSVDDTDDQEDSDISSMDMDELFAQETRESTITASGVNASTRKKVQREGWTNLMQTSSSDDCVVKETSGASGSSTLWNFPDSLGASNSPSCKNEGFMVAFKIFDLDLRIQYKCCLLGLANANKVTGRFEKTWYSHVSPNAEQITANPGLFEQMDGVWDLDLNCGSGNLLTSFFFDSFSNGGATKLRLNYECAKGGDLNIGSMGDVVSTFPWDSTINLVSGMGPYKVTSMKSVKYFMRGADKVECPFGHGLGSWSFGLYKHTESGGVESTTALTSLPSVGSDQADYVYYHTYQCTVVGNAPKLGAMGHCKWVGDPHFWTFDGTRLDTVRGTYNNYWIVRSNFLEVQSFFQGRWPGSNMLTRGLVFGGRLMAGHKLIIKEDVNWLKSPSQPVAFKGNVPNIVQWDHSPLTQIENTKPGTVTKSFTDGDQQHTVTITRSRHRVTAQLPYNIKVRVDQYGYYSNNYLDMPSMNEDFNQDGQCGNFDGKSSNDARSRLQYSFKVTDNENLFKPGVTSTQPGGLDGLSESDCPSADRATYSISCKDLMGSTANQVFIDMCIFDLCRVQQNRTWEEMMTKLR
jgi:hypothetical protein